MILLKISNNKVSIVDDSFRHLSKYTWCLMAKKYAGRRDKISGKIVLMHREILGASKGECVDHKNGDGLDNRLVNIRICTHQQNMMNRKKPENNTSGYKGVTWDKQMKAWRAQGRIDGKYKFLGLHKRIEDARDAYNKFALLNFKEFARINN